MHITHYIYSIAVSYKCTLYVPCTVLHAILFMQGLQDMVQSVDKLLVDLSHAATWRTGHYAASAGSMQSAAVQAAQQSPLRQQQQQLRQPIEQDPYLARLHTLMSAWEHACGAPAATIPSPAQQRQCAGKGMGQLPVSSPQLPSSFCGTPPASGGPQHLRTAQQLVDRLDRLYCSLQATRQGVDQAVGLGLPKLVTAAMEAAQGMHTLLFDGSLAHSTDQHQHQHQRQSVAGPAMPKITHPAAPTMTHPVLAASIKQLQQANVNIQVPVTTIAPLISMTVINTSSTTPPMIS